MLKTHCVNGHAFDEANTRYRGNARRCMACDRERSLRYWREGGPDKRNEYRRARTKKVRGMEAELAALREQVATARGLPTDGEVCQSCGSAVKVVWHVPDEVWREVIGGPAGLRCPDCFKEEAFAKTGTMYAFLAVPLVDGWVRQLDALREVRPAAFALMKYASLPYCSVCTSIKPYQHSGGCPVPGVVIPALRSTGGWWA